MLRLHCDRALEYRLGFGESSQYSLNSGYGNIIVYPEILSGWWFGIFSFFPYIGNVIIPTDSLWSLKVMGDPQVTDGCFNKSWSSIFLGWFGVLQFEETSTLYPKQLYIHIYIYSLSGLYPKWIPNKWTWLTSWVFIASLETWLWIIWSYTTLQYIRLDSTNIETSQYRSWLEYAWSRAGCGQWLLRLRWSYRQWTYRWSDTT